ncbi:MULTISPECIES: cation diffusion facilitator family transporter [unclassified Caulobacter]|uniref:cation diffusion facilitator family transporter n=1 Tax=unclassified Caulobacter TaxID=2648921 RepID=UPI000D3B510F|nr:MULTISPECIES: cation diffusion facilitator family transporter [unclassified Caulobacter]PTS89620.1 cation transporter [Caulobacter sp. HMWF009]PTT05897.1 cation transporter [Caulobacter sp. HMWF025]
MTLSALSPETQAMTRRVTALSVAVAAVLIVVKTLAWLASDSVAMLASLSDSGLDLVASLITFFAVRYAAEPPDAEHRFGHGKAEAFSSLMQGGLVFASGALIGQEAIRAMLHPRPVEQGLMAMAVMVVSIVLTLGLIIAQSRVLKSTGSIAVSGDRAHYAADLGSNAVALLGIGAASWLGLSWVDAAAGLIVALWLIWGAIGVFREASHQLMDRELPEEDRRRIIALASEDPRLLGIHQLRTRASGPYVHMQMHADLEAGISLAEAHAIMVSAENRLLEAFPAADIIIHPDPRGKAESHGGLFAEAHHG